MKDKKACIFYFLMTIILLDFGNQLRRISFLPYIEKINNNESVVQEIIENSEEDNMEEFMFMGLRLMEGINIEEFNRRFSRNLLNVYKEVVQNNIKKGLLVNEDGYIRLTEKGVELSNSVMSDFIILDK